MLNQVIGKFREINMRLNDSMFGAEGNAYRPYLSLVHRCLPPSGVIMDIGSGAESLVNYLPEVGDDRILTIAVDSHYEGLARNRMRSRIVANSETLPFRDETMDVVCASCVLEHIENPINVVAECRRVLKKGGALVFYTPNRRSYVASIARVTPLLFHNWVRKLQTGMSSDEVEVCETFYRMNTLSDLSRYGNEFNVVSMETYIGAPCYSTFMPPPVHLLFIVLHKILQRVGWMRRIFGESIIGCWIKTPGPHQFKGVS